MKLTISIFATFVLCCVAIFFITGCIKAPLRQSKPKVCGTVVEVGGCGAGWCGALIMDEQGNVFKAELKLPVKGEKACG